MANSIHNQHVAAMQILNDLASRYNISPDQFVASLFLEKEKSPEVTFYFSMDMTNSGGSLEDGKRFKAAMRDGFRATEHNFHQGVLFEDAGELIRTLRQALEKAPRSRAR